MSAESKPQGTCLGLIPARGGSKRLPGKNLRRLGGKPLIAWTIEAALGAAMLDRVVVSTDDPAIARVSETHGAEVPFVRPPGLSTDTATSLDVVLHALEALPPVDFVVLLQPTSPLREAADIDAAVRLAHDRRADAVVSVCPTDHPPEWCNVLPEDGSMAGFLREEVRGVRSQDLPTSYRLNGAIYVYRRARLLRERAFAMDETCYAYVMPSGRSVDIDTELDLELAEVRLRKRAEGGGQ